MKVMKKMLFVGVLLAGGLLGNASPIFAMDSGEDSLKEWQVELVLEEMKKKTGVAAELEKWQAELEQRMKELMEPGSIKLEEDKLKDFQLRMEEIKNMKGDGETEELKKLRSEMEQQLKQLMESGGIKLEEDKVKENDKSEEEEEDKDKSGEEEEEQKTPGNSSMVQDDSPKMEPSIDLEKTKDKLFTTYEEEKPSPPPAVDVDALDPNKLTIKIMQDSDLKQGPTVDNNKIDLLTGGGKMYYPENDKGDRTTEDIENDLLYSNQDAGPDIPKTTTRDIDINTPLTPKNDDRSTSNDTRECKSGCHKPSPEPNDKKR